jgi:hypothetical protein
MKRMSLPLNLVLYAFLLILVISNKLTQSWSIIEAPLKYFDLSQKANDSIDSSFMFEYNSSQNLDQYRLLKLDNNLAYLIIGAK